MLRGVSEGQDIDLLSGLVDESAPEMSERSRGYYSAVEHFRRKEFTLGEWATERESAAAFDMAVPEDLFKVHREVRGVLVHPRPSQVDEADTEEKSKELGMRIDRILVPRNKLIELGWENGIVGVELKRSGEKIGRGLAQTIDYGRSVFTLEPSKFRVWLDYVFLWPMDSQGGTVASLCAQNRIGNAYGLQGRVRFELMSGSGATLLSVNDRGRVHMRNLRSGTKRGAR